MPEKFDTFEIRRNEKIEKNDLLCLFVWKYLTAIKIRRILERKLSQKYGIKKYKKVGELANHDSVNKKDPLYKFYDRYKHFFKTFNHSSAQNIPAVLIYHASYIEEALEKITKIKISRKEEEC